MVEESRDEVATLLGCASREILFTSGATEANNLAILGLARASARLESAPPMLISSKAEHPSALAPLRILQQDGMPLKLVDLDAFAVADSAQMNAAAHEASASLRVLQWANNETGAVQRLADLDGLDPLKHPVHVDAVQGIGKLPLEDLPQIASSLAVSGHKLGAPKGVGVLRVREGLGLEPLLVGGGQQRGMRSGTESPALAASMAHALRLSLAEQESFFRSALDARQELEKRFSASGIPHHFQHPRGEGMGLPNTMNISFPGLEGRVLVPAMDLAGIEVSAGAACSSGAAQPSPVLLATGLDSEAAMASCRLSFGPDFGLSALEELWQRLSPLLQRLYNIGMP